jgi:predicted alpha-1,2-mannosidase
MRFKLIALLALLIATPAAARETLTQYVDPFIGTDGTGHTSPAASRPFAMVAPGPDNADNGWEYTSGYQYRAPTIMGFSQTRASGTGIPELGDILLQPMQRLRESGFESRYDKKSELARAGYYAVSLTDNDVRVELTSTGRIAFHRYTFASPGSVWLLADFQHGLRFLTNERVSASDVRLGSSGIEGSVDSKNWTTRTIAFSILFDHPIAEYKILPPRAGEKAPRYLIAFDLGSSKILKVKAALATTDVDGARRNMAELPGWDFDRIAKAAVREWENLLGRVKIEADRKTKRIFYTALYHLFLHPSVISDTDGRYRGPTGVIAKAPGKNYYSTLSLWDSFRAAHPLYTLLAPERVDDFVLTMLDHEKAKGYLPLWTIWGGETDTMIGNPALPVIADAWAKGFRGFDGKEALAAMIRTSTNDHIHSDWSLYDKYGYYPFDKVSNEAVSRTLEAGIGDAATAHMAEMLGDTAATRKFGTRAKSWQKLLDPETGLIRGRDSNGNWRTPFDPLQATSPLGVPGDYTEANAWQYSWTPLLHDPEGLIAAMGGRTKFTAMLDQFFLLPFTEGDKFQGQEGLIGQYAHGNEPSHHIAWAYLYSDSPWKAPQLVRRIATQFYDDTPDGIIGNEDAGQMSAWYIFATLGIYPAQPASGQYVAAIPLVKRAVIQVPGRTNLSIERIGNGNRLRKVTIRDKRQSETGIDHSILVKGGTLRFVTAARQ